MALATVNNQTQQDANLQTANQYAFDQKLDETKISSNLQDDISLRFDVDAFGAGVQDHTKIDTARNQLIQDISSLIAEVRNDVQALTNTKHATEAQRNIQIVQSYEEKLAKITELAARAYEQAGVNRKDAAEYSSNLTKDKVEAYLAMEYADGGLGDVATLSKMIAKQNEDIKNTQEVTDQTLQKDRAQSSGDTGSAKTQRLDISDPKNLTEIRRTVEQVVFQQLIAANGTIMNRPTKQNYEELIEKIKELLGIDDMEAASLIFEFALNTNPEVLQNVILNYYMQGYAASALGRNKLIETILQERPELLSLYNKIKSQFPNAMRNAA
jgi:tetratricopeptide (TPR) repeat protein